MTHAVREAVAAFRRTPVLTGVAAAMVGLALFVLGLFGLAAHNLHVALEQVEERVEVVVFLRDDARPADVDAARGELGAMPEVASVRFVSKDEALETARRELGDFDEVLSGLEVNPLPASLEIGLREEARTEPAVERVAAQARSYPFVEDVSYGREWVEKLFALRRVAGVTATVLGAAFAVVAALIIGTALKIAIFARRDEIYIMRLVGATDGFIRRPFLLEGALAGLLGAVMAVGLTWIVFQAVYRFLFQIAWVPPAWVLTGVGAGVAFGMAASALAIRRHLREV